MHKHRDFIPAKFLILKSEPDTSGTMPNMNEWIGDHFAIIILIIALIVAGFTIVITGADLVETLLVSIVLFNIGFQGIMAGVMHWYRPSADRIAKKIGWQPGSPFQKEVAAADGAFGILGVISFFVRGSFLTATVIGASFMLFFMGIGHVLDIRRNKNLSAYNAGTVVYFDLMLPVALLCLLTLWELGF